jgi:TetR/AcrR family transcriptional regulator
MSDVRIQILDAATRAFAENGFDSTPLQAVAEEVGIRKASVLYHFPSKTLLREAVLNGLIARWTLVLPEVLLAAAKADRFEGVVDALHSFFSEDPNRARLLMREALDRPETLRELLTTHVRPWIGVISGQLQAAQKKGSVLADVDPEAYAAIVVQMVVGGLALEATLGSFLSAAAPEVSRRLRDETKRMIRAALFARVKEDE